MKKKRYGKKCPYCGDKVSIFYAATHMHDGEYNCEKCKRYSNIKYNPLIYLLIVLAAVCGFYLGMIAFKESIKGIILSIVPFMVIYLTFPFFFKLVPIKLKKSHDNNSPGNGKKEKDKKDNVKKYIPKGNTNEFDVEDKDGKTRYIPSIK